MLTREARTRTVAAKIEMHIFRAHIGAESSKHFFLPTVAGEGVGKNGRQETNGTSRREVGQDKFLRENNPHRKVLDHSDAKA